MSYPVLQLNSAHQEWVKRLQARLNALSNAGLSVDGGFGPKTEKAVKAFQKSKNTPETGIVDAAVWKMLERHPRGTFTVLADIDLLSEAQYVRTNSSKVGICLHHTASDGNPHAVRSVWDGDSRGRVATHFVVGRTLLNGDSTHNGKLIQCFPLEHWAYHIATSRMGFSQSHSDAVNSKYIGIEICNWGNLDKKGSDFYNYLGQKVPASQVVELDKPFRTYKYWHAYTAAQLKTVEELLLDLLKRYNFKIEKPFDNIDESWLELSWDALASRRVLTTHTNFEYGKFDCFPQPEFLEMLQRVYR